MSPSQSDRGGRAAVRLSVRGVMQGVGFRPFVYSLAQRHALTGCVRNTSAGVEILAEGAPAGVDACERTVAEPEGARPRRAHRSLGSLRRKPVTTLEPQVDPFGS
jgi:acylphosphatase